MKLTDGTITTLGLDTDPLIGKFNKEIADILNNKPDTIAKHLEHIFQKLGVQNRKEATLRFLEMTGRLILVTV